MRKNLNRNVVPLIFEPYDIAVVNELPDIHYYPIPKCSDQTPCKKSDFNLVQDNAQNQDNLNNALMTSSSNSTNTINKRSLSPKKSVKRMCYVGDFKLSDLDSPRKDIAIGEQL
ncbi:hypothetical protein QTP88_029122 [Uroleucon formosanum]